MPDLDGNHHYRALISIPVTAPNDDVAFDRAVDFAHSLRSRGVVIGHLELLGEIAAGELLRVERVVYETGELQEQTG